MVHLFLLVSHFLSTIVCLSVVLVLEVAETRTDHNMNTINDNNFHTNVIYVLNLRESWLTVQLKRLKKAEEV